MDTQTKSVKQMPFCVCSNTKTKTRQVQDTCDSITRQDKTRQDKTRQDKTRQDKTRQDETRQDKTRRDKTRQDKKPPGPGPD